MDAIASKQQTRLRLVLLLAGLDLTAILVGVLMVAWLYLGRIDHERVRQFLPLLVPFYYLSAIRQHAYDPPVFISASNSTWRGSLALLTALLAVVSITFLFKSSEATSRGLAIGGVLASGILMLPIRHFFARFSLRQLDGTQEGEIVLVDNFIPPATCEARKVDLQAMGLEPDINDPAMLDRLGRIIRGADRVIIACQPERRAAWSLALKGAGVNVEVLTPELDLIGAISTTRYHDMSTTLVGIGRLGPVDRIMKRAFDLAIALPALVVLSPLLLLTAIAIKVDSPGPVLFVQPRIGQGNRLFRMFKFRSMRTDMLDHTASKLTTRNDARVTRVGRFIRKTSLDELPQLLNVLRGDMSIVGPRPHATGATAGDALYWEVSTYYWSRHAVKPGLTGLAQVRGFRGNTETGDDLINWLQADLAYLESWTIWRDVTLVFQTFGVLVHRNAF